MCRPHPAGERDGPEDRVHGVDGGRQDADGAGGKRERRLAMRVRICRQRLCLVFGCRFCVNPQTRNTPTAQPIHTLPNHPIHPRPTHQTVKRVSLELGGNAPFLVMADADLALAAKGVVLSALRNSGQTCICANRVFVHDKVRLGGGGAGASGGHAQLLGVRACFACILKPGNHHPTNPNIQHLPPPTINIQPKLPPPGVRRVCRPRRRHRQGAAGGGRVRARHDARAADQPGGCVDCFVGCFKGRVDFLGGRGVGEGRCAAGNLPS
jgi:hypothetical protein